MVIKVGVNGFGRIGRVIFRNCFRSKELEVSAINDPAVDIEYICYLIKFDSTHGKFQNEVSFSGNEISIADKKIKVFSEKLPSSIPWQSAEVRYVVEASGMFTNLEKASGHLASESVERVIVTAPTVDVPMLILGVNKEQISTEQKVISCASSTLYCLAPIVKILEDKFGVAEGFITSIHAMTPSLKPLDGLCLKGKHWRDHRSIHQNIIPAATGACRALGKIIPSVKDKLTGLAFRVPIINVSVLDITVRLNKDTSLQEIIKCVETESKSTMKNIIKISKDQEVSSDFLGEENSCILDINSSLELNPKFFKLICWYENEYSYACRVVDSIKYSEENHRNLMTKIPLSCTFAPNQSVYRKHVPDFNKEFIISYCNIQNQETCSKSKSLEPQVVLEKSAPLLRSEPNQIALRKTIHSNDIFKVWNDEVQKSSLLAKENRNPFFQSLTFEPFYSQDKNLLKTETRLDGVKKVSSNMTEDLLKESNQSKDKYYINILEGALENKAKEKGREELDKERLTLPVISKSFPTSGVFKKNCCSLYKDVFKTKQRDNSNLEVDSKKQNQDMETKCLELCANPKISDNNASTQFTTDTQDEENSNITMGKDKMIHQLYIETTNDVNKTPLVYNNSISLKETDSSVHRNHAFKTRSPDIATEKLSKHDIQHDVQMLLSAKMCSQMILRNDINDNVSDKNDINNEESSVNFTNPESSKVRYKDDEIAKRDEIRKKIFEGILKILSADATADKTRNLRVNMNPTISGAANKTLDIYDKIDSASGTDSENSFQINEKTSQVIDLKDLTSSAEDLSRLDKICRIIEISDDMSDKLFSALDNNVSNNIRKGKWSFNDLCERLKLDEFCNNVFGNR